MLQSQRDQYEIKKNSHLVHLKIDSRKLGISSVILDKIADEKFSANFNLKKDNLCTECYEYKSVNGSCSC